VFKEIIISLGALGIVIGERNERSNKTIDKAKKIIKAFLKYFFIIAKPIPAIMEGINDAIATGGMVSGAFAPGIITESGIKPKEWANVKIRTFTIAAKAPPIAVAKTILTLLVLDSLI